MCAASNQTNDMLDFVEADLKIHLHGQISFQLVGPASAEVDRKVRGLISLIQYVKDNGELGYSAGIIIDRIRNPRDPDGGQMAERVHSAVQDDLLGVVVVRNKELLDQHTKNTRMVIDFRKDEVLAYWDLDDSHHFATLHSFALHGDEVHFHTQQIEGISVHQIITNHREHLERQDIRDLTLWITRGLLEAVEDMRRKGIAAGNISEKDIVIDREFRVVKLDLMNALRGDNCTWQDKAADIMAVIQLMCNLWCGYKPEPREIEAWTQPGNQEDRDLHQLTVAMHSLPEEDRRVLFSVMSHLCKATAENRNQRDNIRSAQEIIKKNLKDVDRMQRVLYVLMNPGEYQNHHAYHRRLDCISEGGKDDYIEGGEGEDHGAHRATARIAEIVKSAAEEATERNPERPLLDYLNILASHEELQLSEKIQQLLA